jgi:hypothetical protein
MPLALLGTKALIYNNPATRASWASHATVGFYVGPAIDHYCCLQFYIPATHCLCFSDTWRLYPSHCQVPILSEQDDKTLWAVGNILEKLGGTIPTTASAKNEASSCDCTTIHYHVRGTRCPIPGRCSSKDGCHTSDRGCIDKNTRKYISPKLNFEVWKL